MRPDPASAGCASAPPPDPDGPVPGSPLPQPEAPIHLLLKQSAGTSRRIDLDLWLAILDLASTHGWRPRMTSDPDPGLQLKHQQDAATLWTPSAYYLPCGQRIGPTDARELATGAETGLAGVSVAEIPLTNERFGEDHTKSLIELAAKDHPPSRADAEGAFQILSGQPAKEALSVLKFLRGGEIRIYPHKPKNT